LVFADIDQNRNLDHHRVCSRPPRRLLADMSHDNINSSATNVGNPNIRRGNESFQDGVYYFNKTRNEANLLEKPVNNYNQTENLGLTLCSLGLGKLKETFPQKIGSSHKRNRSTDGNKPESAYAFIPTIRMFQNNDSSIRQLEKTRNEYTGLVDSISTSCNNMKPTNKEPTHLISGSKASQSQTNRGLPLELQGLDKWVSLNDAPRLSERHSMLRNSSKKYFKLPQKRIEFLENPGPEGPPISFQVMGQRRRFLYLQR
jgi:hypothetical protein